METRKGTVNCSCGQIFGFETVRDSVSCLKCAKTYNVEDYVVQDVEVIEEPIQLEITEESPEE